jgi:hypothetical protein
VLEEAGARDCKMICVGTAIVLVCFGGVDSFRTVTTHELRRVSVFDTTMPLHIRLTQNVICKEKLATWSPYPHHCAFISNVTHISQGITRSYSWSRCRCSRILKLSQEVSIEVLRALTTSP